MDVCGAIVPQDAKWLRDAVSFSIEKKKPWASPTTAPAPTCLSVGTVRIFVDVLRCSSHPEVAVGVGFFGDEGDGAQLCCSHLLRWMCSIPLETEVSVHGAGLGRWLGCPSPHRLTDW